jgi:rhodanese-related sulfurtransferase
MLIRPSSSRTLTAFSTLTYDAIHRQKRPEAIMGYTITPTELKTRLDKGDTLVLLDVREQWEFDLAKLSGSTLIPLGTLPQSLAKLNRDAEIIAICHHGMRSADATNFLLQQGFPNVKNLVGGIDAWSAQIDRSVPRY